MREFMNILNESQEEFDKYMHGECDIYALAMNELLGWKLAAEFDEDDNYFHVYVVSPDNKLIDYSGERDIKSDEELSSYHGYPVELRDISREWLINHLPERFKSDYESRIEAAKEVILS